MSRVSNRRGSALLTTVLVAAAAATLAFVALYQLADTARTERARQDSATALSEAAALLDRLEGELSAEPLLLLRQVHPLERSRICTATGDEVAAGEVWPAACGTSWEYPSSASADTELLVDANGTTELKATARVRRGQAEVALEATWHRSSVGVGLAVPAGLDLDGFDQVALTLSGLVYANGMVSGDGTVTFGPSVLVAAGGFPPDERPAGSLDGTDPADRSTISRLVGDSLQPGAVAAALADLYSFGCPTDGSQSAVLCLAPGATLTVLEHDLEEVPGATGGTIVEDDRYVTHRFDTDGEFVVTDPGMFEVLIVAGGGAGGGVSSAFSAGGGGGAGQVLYIPALELSEGTVSVTVGSGGTPSAGSTGGDGGDSMFGSFVSLGGAGGAGAGDSGAVGGSGSGGGATTTEAGATGTADPQRPEVGVEWGHDAAPGTSGSAPTGGGGGGAGGPANASQGGAALTILSSTVASGGAGGAGATDGLDAVLAGSGGGGAANASDATERSGGSGADGVVIVRYRIGNFPEALTAGENIVPDVVRWRIDLVESGMLLSWSDTLEDKMPCDDCREDRRLALAIAEDLHPVDLWAWNLLGMVAYPTSGLIVSPVGVQIGGCGARILEGCEPMVPTSPMTVVVGTSSQSASLTVAGSISGLSVLASGDVTVPFYASKPDGTVTLEIDAVLAYGSARAAQSENWGDQIDWEGSLIGSIDGASFSGANLTFGSERVDWRTSPLPWTRQRISRP